MGDTRCYTIRSRELQADTIVALLSELDFDSFEAEANSVRAYLPEERSSPVLAKAVEQLAERFGLEVSSEVIGDRNWNAEWEAAYAPVEIPGFLRISAPFHPSASGFEHELVIVPEMSFGTGHHETTYLMSELLRDYAPFGKTCFDFGTGTGVLAMLAAKLGASRVDATDIDRRCVESTRANAERNGVVLGEVRRGTQASLPPGPYDLILANINRGVLVDCTGALAQRLAPGGELWVSGILSNDLGVVDEVARPAGLTRVERRQRGNWLACRYALKQTI